MKLILLFLTSLVSADKMKTLSVKKQNVNGTNFLSYKDYKTP